MCALQWNPHEREILSSHGFSQNQLCLWKYPSLAKVGEFRGHSARVLHMARVRALTLRACDGLGSSYRLTQPVCAEP